jgi:hypothetical protein
MGVWDGAGAGDSARSTHSYTWYSCVSLRALRLHSTLGSDPVASPMASRMLLTLYILSSDGATPAGVEEDPREERTVVIYIQRDNTHGIVP